MSALDALLGQQNHLSNNCSRLKSPMGIRNFAEGIGIVDPDGQLAALNRREKLFRAVQKLLARCNEMSQARANKIHRAGGEEPAQIYRL